VNKAIFAALGVLVLVTISVVPNHASSFLPLTRVFLNGVPTPVYFNDGDSFRVMGGPMDGAKTRLAGFNTLESFGAVHSWGTFTMFELYVVAKQATYNARRGTWHCTSDLSEDTYGRTLWYCPDLAVDDIRKGLAHVMSVDEEPGRIEYIRAQRLAIAERRGIWAHGVPDFVLTSLHAANEDPTRDHTYNRIVSTVDGHSEPWEHDENYPECTTVCHQDTHVDPARVDAVTRQLREDQSLVTLLANIDNLHLAQAVSRYARTDEMPTWMSEETAHALTAHLAPIKASGAFGTITTVQGACHLYVPFNRRFGIRRASCLGH
jgi:endonuclease YncB( thermonuclease family)